MSNLKVKHLINSLEKWLGICVLLEKEDEQEIIRCSLEQLIIYKEIYLNQIMSNINTDVKKDKMNKNKGKKKNTVNENKKLIKYYIEIFNEKDVQELEAKKFTLITFNEDIKEIWKNSSDESKKKATTFELNLIYNIIYRFDDIKYTSKPKEKIIKDIDEYIKNAGRNNAIEKLLIK